MAVGGSCDAIDVHVVVLSGLFPVAGWPVVRQPFLRRVQVTMMMMMPRWPGRVVRSMVESMEMMVVVVMEVMELVDVAVTSVGWLFLAQSLIVGFLVDDEQLVASRCHSVPSLVTSVALLVTVVSVATMLLLLLLLLRMMEVMGSVVVVGGTAVAAADLAIRHR